MSANHLANAISGLVEDTSGELQLSCDIVFFAGTIAGESRRFREYYEQGYLDRLPFTLRSRYASILAHELAHCLQDRPHNEAAARGWEKRVLRLMRGSVG